VTRDGGSGDWAERQTPRRSGRHSRAPRDYGVPDPYAAPDPHAQPAPGSYGPTDPYAAPGRYSQPDPYASAGSYGAPGPYDQTGPYPPGAPGAPAGPYRGQESAGALPGPLGQADPYGQAGRNGQADPYGRRGHADPEPDPYARTDPNATLGPYAQAEPSRGGQGPRAQPGSLPGRDPLRGGESRGARDPLPGRDPLSGSGSYGGRDPLPGRDPLSGSGSYGGRDPLPGRDPLSGSGSYGGRDPLSGSSPLSERDSFPGRDPLAQADPRYGQPSARRRDPHPPRDGYTPYGPRDSAPSDTGARTDAYGRPGPYPPADLHGQGHGRQHLHGGSAGYGQQNGAGRPAGGGVPEYPRRDTNGRGGFSNERGGYDPAALSGAEDHGPFRWRPAPDAGPPPEAPPAVAGFTGGTDHEPARPGSGDWGPGPASGPPAGRRRSPDVTGPEVQEPGPGTAAAGEWPFGEGEPASWDDEPAPDGIIPGFGERPDTRRGRSGRPRRRVGRVVAPVLAPLVALVVLVALAVGGYKIYQKFQSPDYSGPGTGEVTVQVLSGDTAESLAPRLVSLGVVASTSSFVSAVKHSSDPTGLQPGFFRLHKHMNSALAYKLLLNPASRIQSVVTIPEGLRLTQILSLLGAKSAISASSYAKAVKDTAALGLPAYAKGNPEGYLFPATYDVNPGMSATSVLQAMVARFKQEAASISLPQAAAADHLTPGQVIVVASILEAEGGNPKYYSRVAEVIYNRLNSHWFLGLDSTVNYALHRSGASLTVKQLHVNSPYNTFLHHGLPPGPIDSPGDLAIQAALHPAHGNFTYFITVDLKTGLTDFTNSSSVFDQLVALCQRNKSC
jgi:UPF0755 protein